MKKFSRQAGFTLMEMLIAIAIVAILIALALPSFSGMMDRQRVRGAAENLYADMQYAKGESIKRNVSVSVVATAGPPWSYCVTISNCATAADVLKNVSGADFANVTLGADASVTFDALRGGCAGADCGVAVTFTGSSGATHSVTVSTLGHINLQ